MKKTNLIAMLIAAVSVVFLSNGILASAQDTTGTTNTSTDGKKSGPNEILGFKGLGMFGMGSLNNKNITMSAEKINNGITITETSTDANTVKKLQDMAYQIDLRSSINRTVENISNGIVVTTTSENPDAVKLIQDKIPKNNVGNNTNSKFQVTWETLPNGTKETITSTDPNMVTKLQSGSANGMGKAFGNMRNKFKTRMGMM